MITAQRGAERFVRVREIVPKEHQVNNNEHELNKKLCLVSYEAWTSWTCMWFKLKSDVDDSNIWPLQTHVHLFTHYCCMCKSNTTMLLCLWPRFGLDSNQTRSGLGRSGLGHQAFTCNSRLVCVTHSLQLSDCDVLNRQSNNTSSFTVGVRAECHHTGLEPLLCS